MLTRNLPIFLVFGAAFLIGVGVIIAALVNADDDDSAAPISTLSEFDAAQLAKSAYYGSDPTVAAAECNAKNYDEGTDIWEIECTMERDGGTIETTQWRVTPDGNVVRVNDATAGA